MAKLDAQADRQSAAAAGKDQGAATADPKLATDAAHQGAQIIDIIASTVEHLLSGGEVPDDLAVDIEDHQSVEKPDAQPAFVTFDATQALLPAKTLAEGAGPALRAFADAAANEWREVEEPEAIAAHATNGDGATTPRTVAAHTQAGGTPHSALIHNQILAALNRAQLAGAARITTVTPGEVTEIRMTLENMGEVLFVVETREGATRIRIVTNKAKVLADLIERFSDYEGGIDDWCPD